MGSESPGRPTNDPDLRNMTMAKAGSRHATKVGEQRLGVEEISVKEKALSSGENVEPVRLNCTHPGAGQLCDRCGTTLMVGYLLGDKLFDETPGVWITCEAFHSQLHDRLIVASAMDATGMLRSDVHEHMQDSRPLVIATFVDVMNKVERTNSTRGSMLSKFVDRYDQLMESLVCVLH